MKRLINILSYIYGTGVALALLAGGLSFFGYLAAFCIGGETATAICVLSHFVLFLFRHRPAGSFKDVSGRRKVHDSRQQIQKVTRSYYAHPSHPLLYARF